MTIERRPADLERPGLLGLLILCIMFGVLFAWPEPKDPDMKKGLHLQVVRERERIKFNAAMREKWLDGKCCGDILLLHVGYESYGNYIFKRDRVDLLK